MDKGKFIKVYSNLPASARNEVIIIIPEIGPLTWHAAYLEIENDTELGNEIIRKLEALNFI